MSSDKLQATEGRKEVQEQKRAVNEDILDSFLSSWESTSSTDSNLETQSNQGKGSAEELPVLMGSSNSLDGLNAQSGEASIDDLLADFLTPDEELPCITGTFSPVQSTSRPEILNKGLTPGHHNTPASGTHSANLLDQPFHSGLQSFENTRSSGEWKAPSHSGSLDASDAPTTSSTTSEEVDWSIGRGLIDEDTSKQITLEQRATRAKERKRVKRDQKTVVFKVILRILVRTLILLSLAYVAYHAYRNGF